MQKEPTELDTITAEWETFSKTLAYKKLIEYIEMQKEINTILASGPLEVGIMDENKDMHFDFEPEKYAYLLQRSVGCDIVKIYVEGFTTSA